MGIKTIVTCERCSKDHEVNGQASQEGLKAFGYETVLNRLLCGDCVKAVANYISVPSKREKDSGFTDGRPVPADKKHGA